MLRPGQKCSTRFIWRKLKDHQVITDGEHDAAGHAVDANDVNDVILIYRHLEPKTAY